MQQASPETARMDCVRFLKKILKATMRKLQIIGRGRLLNVEKRNEIKRHPCYGIALGVLYVQMARDSFRMRKATFGKSNAGDGNPVSGNSRPVLATRLRTLLPRERRRLDSKPLLESGGKMIGIFITDIPGNFRNQQSFFPQ